MELRFWTASSQDEDPRRACAEAGAQALKNATHPALAVVFCSHQYAPTDIAAHMSATLGSTPWIGCSTRAVLHDSTLLTHGVVVGVFDGSSLRVGTGVGAPIRDDARQAGASATRAALRNMPLTPTQRRRLLLMFPDTRAGNTAELLRGAVTEGGAGAAWAGGGAGDNVDFLPTAQFICGETYTGRAVVAAIDCPARVGVGVRHGWRPSGPSAMVTDSDGAVTRALEYGKAADVYLAAEAEEGAEAARTDGSAFRSYAMTHPLGIPQLRGEYLIRDPLSLTDDGSIVCLGEVPTGSLVRRMSATTKEMEDAAHHAAVSARQTAGGALAGALVFDCVSRYIACGATLSVELRAIIAGLDGARFIGCLTFGEIGAFGERFPQFHNKTTVVVALPSTSESGT